MQQQRGFTLIELIIVIVILGILAVTAAPRFIDLQGDARAATLDGVRAAMQGGAQLVYARAAIDGVQTSTSVAVTINNVAVTTEFGYPSGDAASVASLAAWLDASLTASSTSTNGEDFLLTVGSPDADSFAITPFGTAFSATAASQCQVIYTEAGAAGEVPTIAVQDDGC